MGARNISAYTYANISIKQPDTWFICVFPHTIRSIVHNGFRCITYSIIDEENLVLDVMLKSFWKHCSIMNHQLILLCSWSHLYLPNRIALWMKTGFLKFEHESFLYTAIFWIICCHIRKISEAIHLFQPWPKFYRMHISSSHSSSYR